MSEWPRMALLLAVAAVGLFVGGFYLSVYVLNAFETPIGWDVPKYLWRTSLASDVGVTDLPARVPPPVNASPDRPGYPVVALSLERLVPSPGSLDGRLLFAALPIIGLAALGLAAGALVVVGFGRPWWQGAMGAAFVGTSSLGVRLAGPEAYIDNILAGAVLLAALTLLAWDGGPARLDHGGPGNEWAGAFPGPRTWAITALLVAGAAIHWAFFAVVWLSIAGAVVWRRRGWFGVHAGGRGRAMVVVLLGPGRSGADLPRPGAWPNLPVVDEASSPASSPTRSSASACSSCCWRIAGLFMASRRRTLPGRPWEGLPRRAHGVAGRLLVAVLLKELGVAIPAHRLVAACLPVPIFAFSARSPPASGSPRAWAGDVEVGGRAGPVVAAVLLGTSLFLALDTWTETQPEMEPAKVGDAALVERYLDEASVPASRPVVFIVEDRAGNPDFTIP